MFSRCLLAIQPKRKSRDLFLQNVNLNYVLTYSGALAGSNAGTISGTATINSAGNLVFFRSDLGLALSQTIAGSGTLHFRGTGVSLQSDYIPTGVGAGFTGKIVVNNLTFL